MKKFLLIYHTPKEVLARHSSLTEDEINVMMESWMKWKEDNESAVIDFGNPVGAQHVVSPSDSKQVSDDVTGYGIIQAESLDEAKKVLNNHPSLTDEDGSTISLYEIVEM
jgi:hypothetical protein